MSSRLHCANGCPGMFVNVIGFMIGKMAHQQVESAVDFLGQSYALDHFVNDPDAATGNLAIATVNVIVNIATTKHRNMLILPVSFHELFLKFSLTFVYFFVYLFALEMLLSIICLNSS